MPGHHSRVNSTRQRRRASSHALMISAGMTMPIKPLANTPRAAAAYAAASALRYGSPRSLQSAAWAASTTEAVMQPVTSMSKLANCAAPKNSGCASNTSKVVLADRRSAQRRTNR